MYSCTDLRRPCRSINVANIAADVVPMNSSYSALANEQPSNASTEFSTVKCSGSRTIRTPSMSKTTASKRAIAHKSVSEEGGGGTPQYAFEVLSNGVARTGVLVQADQPWADAQLAALYDAFVFADDLPLYIDLARTQGSRVLEVACGSGRVLLPLVCAGFDVIGIVL